MRTSTNPYRLLIEERASQLRVQYGNQDVLVSKTNYIARTSRAIALGPLENVVDNENNEEDVDNRFCPQWVYDMWASPYPAHASLILRSSSLHGMNASLGFLIFNHSACHFNWFEGLSFGFVGGTFLGVGKLVFSKKIESHFPAVFRFIYNNEPDIYTAYSTIAFSAALGALAEFIIKPYPSCSSEFGSVLQTFVLGSCVVMGATVLAKTIWRTVKV